MAKAKSVKSLGFCEPKEVRKATVSKKKKGKK